MNQTTIFWPMIAHVALVYAVYVLLAVRRRTAVASGRADNSRFRENRDEPAESLFVRNNLANQFELPVLFYAGCLALHAVSGVNIVTLTLAWIFVATRCAHSWVHVTSNRLRHRQPAFILGFLALAALWLMLALRLLGDA